jgi:two-component system OmpR family sensor kinase
VSHRKWIGLFAAVAFLILLQIGWWATLFMHNVDTIEELRLATPSIGLSHDEILRQGARQRLMFLSESLFFGLLTLIGLSLLYAALRREARSRTIQRNFIEIVTHESKTPLTALKLRLESVLDRNPAFARELGLALDEVRRLTSVFEKALSLNRLERHAFSFEQLRLGDIVASVQRRLDPFLRSRGALIEPDIDSDVWVSGDRHGLENSLQSLVENAVLYNDRPLKRVRIFVERAGSSALLSVEDDGPGVETQARPHVFERFYRGPAGRKVPGTGLGLSLTKTIVEAHHGSIRLAESRLDRGTRFVIELPAGAAS